MGITLFRRPTARKEGADSEFAATVATLPPGAEAAIPLPPAGQVGEGSPDSVPPDSQPFDSQPFDSQPFGLQGDDSQSFDSQSFDSQSFDSQSFDSQLPDSQSPELAEQPSPPAPPPDPFDPHPPKELPAYLGGRPEPPPSQPLEAAATESTDPVAMADQPTIAQVGRYALKRHLGVGGLGQVHEAWDPLLSRTVAIKTLQFESDPRTRNSLDRLFLNEARAVAGLSHPNIVTVYDAGLSPQGVYLAMERLQGKDLRQRLQEGWKPGPAVAAQLVRRVTDALAYAHARGVVHCDIKPGNIFITGSDKPKVLDFGIARVAHGRAVPAALQGTVAGSPHYLAPEQLLGKDVDARTDIYSLGVVFYELLSGRRAFAGDSVEQITTAVLTNHPAPAHFIRSGVPEALSAIAARAMARDPEARYATASEMAADIRNWFEQPRTPSPSRAEEKRSKRAQRAERKATEPAAPRRWPWALAGASAALLAVLAVGLVLVLRPGARPAAVEAGAQRPAGGATASNAGGTAPAPAAAATAPREGDIVMSGGVPVATGGVPASGTATIGTPGATAAPAAGTPAAATATQPPTGAGTGAPGTAGTTAATPAGDKPGGAGSAGNAGSATEAPAGQRRPANRTGTGRDADTRRAGATGAATSAGSTQAAVYGTLHLAISPWGQVEIDGQSVGTAPPLTQFTLSAGSHVVTVRNADFPPFTTTVQVQADRATVIRHRFGQ